MTSRISTSDSQEIDQPLEASPSGVLSVRVDGVESACLRIASQPFVRFEIAADAEWIEVATHSAARGEHAAAEIPLASWFLPFDSASGEHQAVESSVLLSNGEHRLSLRVSPRRNTEGDVDRSDVELRLHRHRS